MAEKFYSALHWAKKAERFADKVKGSVTAIEGRIGDIGFSAFGIDESLNTRRYLNGQVISQDKFKSFAEKIKEAIKLYPNIATTEENWQAEVTNSKLGQCGKFVIDDALGTIRLPKVVNIQGLSDLALMGSIKAESLPNIIGTWQDFSSGYYNSSSGAFYQTNTSEVASGNWSSGKGQNKGMGFNASRSSSTYQDNAPVQQEAVQYPYFIQVATGVETSVDVSREIELNNPFSLLDYKYSEYELSNASWLLSNGQWNSGAVYQSVYDLLLQIYNGTVTKAGVSVKLSTETYADTDFVLNTTDTTFRLPIKVLLAGSKRVAGNGMTLGFTDGTNMSGSYASATRVEFCDAAYGDSVGNTVNHTSTITNGKNVGVTTDPTKSGIETSSTGLYLYFYVGETVQNANIIAAAGVLTDVADLKNASNFSQTGLSNLSGLGMPSDMQEAITVGAAGANYVAPANGWFVCIGTAGYIYLTNKGKNSVEKIASMCQLGSGIVGKVFVPAEKDDVVNLWWSSSTISSFTFVYAEGEN